MRLWALCGVVVLVLGCAGSPRAPEAQSALVTSLELDFPSRERGQLAFSVRLPSVSDGSGLVTWELMLSGVRFAAGVEGGVPVNGGVVQVKASLPSRHLTWREGAGWLDVSIEGRVDFGTERVLFRDRRELLVHHRPQAFDEKVIR